MLFNLFGRAENVASVDQRPNVIGSIQSKIEKHLGNQDSAWFIVARFFWEQLGVIL